MTLADVSQIEPAGRVISLPAVKAAQRRQVVLVNGIACLGIPAAAIAGVFWGVSSIDLVLFLTMWALTMGVGISVGFHRHFTHRAFEARTWVRMTLAVLGSMAGQGPLFAWVAIHRRHHEYSDTQGDPHSPQLSGTGLKNAIRGLWHAHFGWFMDYDMPNPLHYAADLIKEPQLGRVSRGYLNWVIVGLLLPCVIGGAVTWSASGALTALIWGGLVRLFVSAQITWSINSVCHMIGHRTHNTNDHSVNNVWLAIPSFGEAWHNNHHYSPSSASFSSRWWQVDSGYWVIMSLSCVGLVWNIRPGVKRSPQTIP
jgi:stearoyl-CoA desaturase (delta-9 desaturase)